MAIPEYLILFPNQNNGDIEVAVKFKNYNGCIRNAKISASEIEKIINPDNGKFYTKMTFDEHLFEVTKYEINPIDKKITIHVKNKIDS